MYRRLLSILFLAIAHGDNKLIMDRVNYYRAQHMATPVVWNTTLETLSDKWAQQLAKKDALEHEAMIDAGENLYYTWSSSPIIDAIDDWYSEVKNYNFNFADKNDPSQTLHFTQLVWNSSLSIGASFARRSTGAAYVVMRFSPHGNVWGEFWKNVFPKMVLV